MMDTHDVVVIGGSAGGIAALKALVSGLPSDFAAAVFVVVHVPAYAPSRLPEILDHSGALPAHHARHDEPILPGRIYVAPPDRHLLVRPGRIELSRGPRENHSRPAIDPLFRTAARAYGRRVIGIVLSGALHDGSLGLLAVKTRGGVAIVQDPNEAVIDSMPRSALKLVSADYVLPVSEIPGVLRSLVAKQDADNGGDAVIDDEERLERAVEEDFFEQAADQRALETTVYSCPECGGVLWQTPGPLLKFRCHVGHAYSGEVLLSEHSERLEAALWTSLRLLKERATLSRQMATRLQNDPGDAADRMEEQARRDEEYVESLRVLLEHLPVSPD
jgi:two-component system chemotaxis response regulator CheB